MELTTRAPSPHHLALATLFPTPRIVQTAENRYWDKLKYPIVVKEFSAVTSVNFCPVAPFNFAVTSSLKVCCALVHVCAPVLWHVLPLPEYVLTCCL